MNKLAIQGLIAITSALWLPAQADLTRASAEQRNAQSAYQRTWELYENQNASKNDLDTARAAFESAEALVNVSKRALDIAQLNVSYTRLEATESCSVAATNVEVGENVSSGQVIAWPAAAASARPARSVTASPARCSSTMNRCAARCVVPGS